MKILIWKSYGDIKAYSAETPEQVESIINTVISCLEDWGIDDEIDTAKRLLQRNKPIVKELRSIARWLVNEAGGDHEMFEYFQFDNLEEVCS